MTLKCVQRIAGMAVIALLLAAATAWAQLDDARRALESAQQSYAQSQFPDAIRILENLVLRAELPPDDLFTARELLARSYVKDGKPLQGRAIFLTMLQIRPDYRPDSISVPPDEQAIFQDALRMRDQGTPSTAPGSPPPPRVANAPESIEAPHSRTPGNGKLVFGFRLGFGVSALGGKGIDDLKNQAISLSATSESSWRPGFAVGFEVRRLLSGSLALQSGVGWVRETGKITVESGNLGDQQEITLDELEIPLLVRGPVFRQLFLVGGPAVAFRIGSRGESKSISGNTEGNLDDQTQTFGLHVLLGAGTPVWNAAGHVVTFEGRYRLGLIDVLSDSPRGAVAFRGVEGSLAWTW